MGIKDPTAWKDDLTFYMTEEAVAGDIEAMEPLLLHGGSKVAAGLWLALVGTLGGAFGAVLLSPEIRRPLTFLAFVIAAALLLRGFHPLTVRVLGKAVGWMSGFAFFWATMLGLVVMLAAGRDATWAAYSVAAGGGFFVGMMYGSFPPGVIRNQDAWGVAFLMAPISASAAAYLLRHPPAVDALVLTIAAGALAGLLLMGVMGFLLVKLWDASEGIAELGVLYLHNDVYATQAVACFDRAIAMRADNAKYYNLRGVALSRAGEAGRAAADWDKATALAPNDPEPYVNRGVDAFRRGAERDAVRWFEAAIEKDPKHGRAHGYLAIALERLGDLTRAFEHYDRSTTLAKDDPKVFCDRSDAHFRRGDYVAALKDAERAVRNESHRGSSYAARGRALAMLGQTGEARVSFQEAIELGVEPSVHEEALRTMEAMPDDEGAEAET
ncbi:MAG TPA: tetratricopeptide repeat protein [Vicinamibacterales bacterium]|nr:tetratricopeptide repeat protein [Vicinamibacterales bacterium]